MAFSRSTLPNSAKAETSQKGFFIDKKTIMELNRSGSAWSDKFPGNYPTVRWQQAAVYTTEIALELTPSQLERTIWRLDGSPGSEQQLRWLVERG